MQEWTSGIFALSGAVMGALGIVVAQWLSGKRSERVAYTGWQQEKARDVAQRTCEFRKERAIPILDALDRASAVYSLPWSDITMLMDEVGYYGEEIKSDQKEVHEKERQKRLSERLDRIVEDMATVARIPDPEFRRLLYKALWKGVSRPEMEEKEHMAAIDEAYGKLEAWIFEPTSGESTV